MIGSIQDLSGPIAGFGKQARLGMLLRVDEINEQGGINGRKIKLLVEDSAYDPKRAVLAAQKLVNQDKIFMMVGHIGTAHEQRRDAGAVREERHQLHAGDRGARDVRAVAQAQVSRSRRTYYDQMRIVLPKLVKEKGVEEGLHDLPGRRVRPRGHARRRGRPEGDEHGVSPRRPRYKRGATDFSSQVARMKAAGCDLVVLGTIIRETIGTIGESRKTGFNPVFLGTSAAYTDLIHKLGGPAMNGLYAGDDGARFPTSTKRSQPIRFWANKYKTKFNEDPTVFSVYGYVIDRHLRHGRGQGRRRT